MCFPVDTGVEFDLWKVRDCPLLGVEFGRWKMWDLPLLGALCVAPVLLPRNTGVPLAKGDMRPPCVPVRFEFLTPLTVVLG